VHPALCIDEPEKTAVDVRAYKAAGGSALVDAQPVFTGRNAETLLRLSGECGVHIVASTGFHKLMYYGKDNPFLALSEDVVAGLFTSEIETGMYGAPFYPSGEPLRAEGDVPAPADMAGGSGRPCLPGSAARAGVIKAALEPEATELHARLFRAAARASLATGAAIMIHVDKGANPLAMAGALAAMGVRGDRLAFCHLDRAEPDIRVHKELASKGAYIEYDTVARPKYHSDEREADIICEMIGAGFADRVLLSLDVTRERLRGYGGGPGLDYLLTNFMLLLRTRGIGGDQLDTIITGNPARFLAVSPRVEARIEAAVP
jgi:phosphotriesterase-related protein